MYLPEVTHWAMRLDCTKIAVIGPHHNAHLLPRMGSVCSFEKSRPYKLSPSRILDLHSFLGASWRTQSFTQDTGELGPGLTTISLFHFHKYVQIVLQVQGRASEHWRQFTVQLGRSHSASLFHILFCYCSSKMDVPSLKLLHTSPHRNNSKINVMCNCVFFVWWTCKDF